MTLDLSEWLIMTMVAAGLIFPFIFLYWLVYNATEDVPKDVADAKGSDAP